MLWVSGFTPCHFLWRSLSNLGIPMKSQNAVVINWTLGAPFQAMPPDKALSLGSIITNVFQHNREINIWGTYSFQHSVSLSHTVCSLRLCICVINIYTMPKKSSIITWLLPTWVSECLTVCKDGQHGSSPDVKVKAWLSPGGGLLCSS